MESEERQLSDRERTVLLLAAEGLTDKEIARHLDLSQRTIGTYWERMRQKLGHYSRTQLVARFLRFEADQEPDSQRYRSLFATWEEGVWILSPAGKTIYANHRIADLFRLNVEQFHSADAHELLRKAANVSLSDVLGQSLHEPHKLELKLQSSSNGPLWLRLSAMAARNAAGESTAVILLLHDVTVQRRVRYTLDTCESTLSFLSNYSSDFIARFDSKLTCVDASPSLLRAVKRSESVVIGRPLAGLQGVFEPLTQWAEGLANALETRTKQSFMSRIDGLDGELTTHLLPVPSEDFGAASIYCLTIVGERTLRR